MALNQADVEAASLLAADTLEAANTTVGAGVSATFRPKTDVRGRSNGYFNATFLVTDAASTLTCILEKSYDNGDNWFPAKDVGGNAATLAVNNVVGAATFQCRETEPGVAYRFRCTAYTDGSMAVRASQ